MRSQAVIFEAPGQLSVDDVALVDPGVDDLTINARWCGISTGTERLLWSGDMPSFPGMGYPLVPGYETVGEVVDAPASHAHRIGERVFVPGSAGYRDVKGLFGGTAHTLVVPAAKAVTVDRAWNADAVLLALAATAHHAIVGGLPDLIVGHGVLGRLMARMTVALGQPDLTVWETDAARHDGPNGYTVSDPAEHAGKTYATIVDVSGDSAVLDSLIRALTPGGEVVLAGFYSQRVGFAFPPAFMKEARLRVAAEWKPADMEAVLTLLRDGRLTLDGLVTHRMPARDAAQAYDTAFGDADCLKMILDWSERA